jgi:hypothetical protein
VQEELLAQIADHTQVIATRDHGYKEVVRVPRPASLTGAGTGPGRRRQASSPSEVAAFFARRGSVRVTG